MMRFVFNIILLKEANKIEKPARRVCKQVLAKDNSYLGWRTEARAQAQ
jgi:hypothetical protein